MKNPYETPTEEKINRTQEIPLEKLGKFTEQIQRAKSTKREKPSEERIGEIKNELEEAADLFQSADVPYIVDGALNISLYKGNFFREHRDIDFGVFSKDIPKLAHALERKGYALFRFPKDVDEKLKEKMVLPHELIRPDEIDISKISREHIFFLRVKDNFEIDTDNYTCFDIHALDQNENGDIVRLNGTVIPKEYYENTPEYTTDSGKKLRLCHPTILAYHKLLEGREHDLADVEYMMKENMLSKENFLELDGLFSQDEEKNWEEDKPKIQKAKKWLLGHAQP